MAIPITIERLLEDNIVEWARIEFKKDWNPDAILKTISAFANDIDNWGGGYIVVGLEEKGGKLVRPIKGLSHEAIERIQKELLQYCKYLTPTYIPITQPVTYQGATLLLIWVPGGYERPYKCPKAPSSKTSEKVYFIRKLSSTILATDSDFKELMSLTKDIPFDDRMNMRSKITDLKHPLIRSYLAEAGSGLFADAHNMSIEELATNLRVADGPDEYFKPLNVGLLFFNENPERFFPYTRIEIVNIPDPTGQGMEERIFTGPIDQQLREALQYIKNSIIAEKIFKISGQAEAERYYNYSYDAIEEFLANAVYHKSYQIHEPITVRVESDKIEITSIPGPDRTITESDLKNHRMKSKRYRNRRIGDFLKDLELIEGRNTGIPTALRAINTNSSPLPKFITDEERTFFSIVMDIHPKFLEEIEQNESNNVLILDEIDGKIVEILQKDSTITQEELSRIVNKGRTTVQTKLKNLQKHKIIARKGSRRAGEWKVIKK